MAIQVICFDLDDTLWPIAPVIEQAEKTLHDWFFRHYPLIVQYFSIDELRELRQRITAQRPDLRHDLTQLRKLSLAQAAIQVGYDESLVEPAFEVFMTARHQVQLYADVLPVLEKLHGRYLLCALTNGNADVQRVGLGHLFETTFFAREVGAAKPEPALFEAVCQYAQVKPSQVVHVGDDAICDVAGAAAVGMRTVWINRQHQQWVGQPIPDAKITSLSQLEFLINDKFY
jgi:putative hydrolase of the HAD superfamily